MEHVLAVGEAVLLADTSETQQRPLLSRCPVWIIPALTNPLTIILAGMASQASVTRCGIKARFALGFAGNG